MKVGRSRILLLAGVFGAAGLVLVMHLYLLMVEQGPMWLERSYRNRWAFKDVPTQRGAILDSRGRVMAEDVPAFALLLHYRAFRREHPLGCAVHGANLMMHAGGFGDDFFGFDGRERGPTEAMEALLAMPNAWLHRGPVPSHMVRDLRFYVVSLVAALTARPWTVVYRHVRDTPLDERATVADALAELEEGIVARARAGFRLRLDEFEEIVAALRTPGVGRTLWSLLEEQRRRHWIEPEAEHVLRMVHRRIPFELAARIKLLGDLHPGLRPQPSVARRNGTVPGRDDLASLRPLIGGVRPYWWEDREELAGKVEGMLHRDVLEQLLPRDQDLPAELADGLQREAVRNVSAHYQTHGRVGQSGLERHLDPWLAGRPGLRLVEKDRDAREQAQWSSLDTTPGRDQRSTLDLDLQARLEDSLDRHAAGRETALAVIDPRTGDVLALGGRPLAAAGEPVWTTPAAVWGGVGYIGSVAKPFVALEQLDAARRGRPHRDHGGFDPCAGGFAAPGLARKLSCEGHGSAAGDPRFAVARSCNFFFFQAAQGLGAAGVLRAYQRAGWVADEADDDPRYQHSLPGVWLAPAALVTRGHVLERRAIGYGVNASALHVARAYAALATGALPRLSLVESDRSHLAVPLDVHPDDLAVVRDGMRDCVVSGTARRVDGLQELGVLAKTGTAEISARTRHNNAWLAGYLTREEPTLAFAAVAYDVPDERHGGEVAGALVADFLTAVHADPELRERYMPGVTGR